jgi:hypothetical protein
MIFKEIPLLPTQYWLDFWQLDSKEQICEEFSKRYGNSIEYYKLWVEDNMESVVESTADSFLGKDKRIVVVVSEMSDIFIIHEIIHVLFDLTKTARIEVNYTSQEWVAYMTEYIFNKIKE